MASSLKQLLAIALVLDFAASYVRAADPDPLADFTPANLTSFVFRGLGQNGVVSTSPGGRRAALNIEIFPALK